MQLSKINLGAILLFFVSCSYGKEEFEVDYDDFDFSGTYLSPGLQVGYTFDKGWFWGAQLTLSRDIFVNQQYTGIANGFRIYSKDKFAYTDIQHSFITSGVGVGFNWAAIESKFVFKNYRSKLWLLGGYLITYDLVFPLREKDRYENSLGSMLVFPHPI